MANNIVHGCKCEQLNHTVFLEYCKQKDGEGMELFLDLLQLGMDLFFEIWTRKK